MVTKQIAATSYTDDGIAVDVYDYYGLSTDDKPTDAAVNAFFLENDTKKLFYFDGEAWQPFGGA